jgi:hypothetical protein
MPNVSLVSTGPMSPNSETCETLDATTLSQLTLFAEASLVSLTASPGNDRQAPTTATYGESLPVSLASLDPDGSWLKTYQDYLARRLDGSSEEFSGTWPRAGTMRNGTVYQRPPLALTTDATESLLLPTPRVHHAGRALDGGSNVRNALIKRMGAVSFEDAILMWPTPSARDWRSGKSSEATRQRNSRPLNEVAAPSGHLNPRWVEWLMGFPDGWTDCED